MLGKTCSRFHLRYDIALSEGSIEKPPGFKKFSDSMRGELLESIHALEGV